MSSYLTKLLLLTLLPVMLSSAIVLTSSVSKAHAQCAEKVSTKHKILSVDGQPGLWFHRKVARCILKELESLSVKKRQVRLLRKQLSLRKEQVQAQRLNSSEAVKRVQILKTLIAEQDQKLQAQNRVISSLGRRWRRPWVWLLIGSGLGAALVIGIGGASL